MGKPSDKTVCKYGAKCYRKSVKHLAEYSHPDDEDSESDVEDTLTSPPQKKTKIDEFFTSNSDNNKKTETSQKDEDDGLVDTAAAAAGQCSGYVREQADSSDDENDTSEAPPSPDDIRQSIKNKYLLDMPQDFYDFWEFSQKIKKNNPADAFKSSLGLQLVGPYDVIAGKHKSAKSPCYHRHWRYYYDPPELQTIIKGSDETQFHMGYFRDDPKEPAVFVASNSAKENCTISPRGDNLFAAILWFLEDKMKKEKIKGGVLSKLKEQITEAAEKGSYCLDQRSKQMKARDKKVVCRSFHGAGLVVPVDDNEVGYRPVPESPADLKRMFKKIVDAKSDDERNKAMDPLMEIVMYIQFANDECDYGEGLELGMDLFSYGGDTFHKMILNLLPLAYQLLNRMEFATIIQAHLDDRKHSADLSVL